ncbi:MAG: hypothetical protein ACHQ2Z_02845 [Elusimicrobiota bacterium]
MPSFADWLKASWEDFRRRWGVLLAVAGAGGGATLAAGFLPFIPASLLGLLGIGPAWAVWGSAVAVSLIAVLWLSTWAQAAMMRAALTDETTRECLTLAWSQTSAFAWVLSLALLAVAGGYFLFIIPGLILTVMLFAAPFCQISGEAEGARALGLSWARVKPHFGEVSLRLFAATVITAAPGWIPFVGWIVMLFWAPFSFIAMARLDKDLRAAEPQAQAPEWMGAAISGLGAVVLIGAVAASFLTVRLTMAAVRSFNQPGGLVSRFRPETAQALMNALTGQASDDQKQKLYLDVLAQIRAPGEVQVAVSSETLRVP